MRSSALFIAITVLPLSTSSCAGGGSLPIPIEPATSISIDGPERLKLAHQVDYTAGVRGPGGLPSDRPVVWLVEPAGAGTITSTGKLIPNEATSIRVIARVDGLADTVLVQAYDWRLEDDGFIGMLLLEADQPIAGSDGEERYPDLVIGCAAGTFVVLVLVEGFELQDGLVSYRIDGGPVKAEHWVGGQGAGGLLYPGTSNASHKQLAAAIAVGKLFEFSFTESGVGPQVARFMVAGLAGRLAPLLERCPSEQ